MVPVVGETIAACDNPDEGLPKMKHSFFIPGTLPGLNEIISAAKSGHGAGNRYRKLKADAEMIVFVAVRNSNPPPFTGPVHIDFQWIAPDRRKDPDNISAGGRKICCDTLQKAGILKGDGWKHIAGFSESFRVDKTNPGVIVTIENAEESSFIM